MNLEQYEAQIDAFFDAVEPNEVVGFFRELGYEFDHKPRYPSGIATFEGVVNGPAGALFDFEKSAPDWQAIMGNYKHANEATVHAAQYVSVQQTQVVSDDRSSFEEQPGIPEYAMAA